eukprot:1367514-Pyramimonas_sp.AAC.1
MLRLLNCFFGGYPNFSELSGGGAAKEGLINRRWRRGRRWQFCPPRSSAPCGSATTSGTSARRTTPSTASWSPP